MNKDALHYSVRSSLPPGPEKPAAIGAKFIKTLDALTQIDSTVFANWRIINYARWARIPIATARSRITEIIEKNVKRDDWRRPQPDEGYTAGALTDAAVGSRVMHLTIDAGGERKKGDTWLQLGDLYDSPPDLSMITYPVFRAALLAINTVWPPSFAWADAYKSDYWETPLFPSAPLFPSSLFHMTWLGYLSAELAGAVKLPPKSRPSARRMAGC
jgi:hypothetical protein